LRRLVSCVAAITLFPIAISAQEQPSNTALIGELMAFHGSKAIVQAMTTHCYENTGLDPIYEDAANNWYLRNIGYIDLANRVIEKLGGASAGQKEAAETYGGSQIMSAFNQAGDKQVFCRTFLEQVESGGLDIDQQLPGILKQAQDISAS
jgi:hypothetical protein